MLETVKVNRENDDCFNEILFREDFNHLKFDRNENEYVVTLIDQKGYEILKGYGRSTIEAINDMHNKLI